MQDTLLSHIAHVGFHLAKTDKTKPFARDFQDELKQLQDMLPSGSGFDSGSKINSARSERVVIETSFHHLNPYGYYDGWTHHTVKVLPVLTRPGFELIITGRDRNGIKDYIHDVFYHCLLKPVRTVFDQQTGTMRYIDVDLENHFKNRNQVS